jgi:GT2 family glycosyltransferase
MKETTNISVILPIHEFNETTKALFAIAVKSVEDQLVLPDELLIVVPKNSEASKEVKAFDFGSIKSIVRVLENDGETDFASQVNFGVKNITTEWFSILEYDDEYAKIWFKNVVTYKKAHPEVGIFLPIIVDTDGTGTFIGLTNEAVWANSFSDELGILELNSLLTYQNFNTDGFVMKKSLYDELGGFKPSIKLTFIYEFLLRMTFKDVRVMVIPRFGYKHMNMRDGSLFPTYQATLNPVEAKWWLGQAKKEYYFENDRKITYDEKTA